MPIYDRHCPACGWLREDVLEPVNFDAPPCPECSAATERVWLSRGKSPNVIGDDIPGGLTLENLGHLPVTVYSKSELRRECDARGLQPFVRHVGERGGDKSKHTTNWAAGTSQAQMDAAAKMIARVDQRAESVDDIDMTGITIEVNKC